MLCSKYFAQESEFISSFRILLGDNDLRDVFVIRAGSWNFPMIFFHSPFVSCCNSNSAIRNIWRTLLVYQQCLSGERRKDVRSKGLYDFWTTFQRKIGTQSKTTEPEWVFITESLLMFLTNTRILISPVPSKSYLALKLELVWVLGSLHLDYQIRSYDSYGAQLQHSRRRPCCYGNPQWFPGLVLRTTRLETTVARLRWRTDVVISIIFIFWIPLYRNLSNISLRTTIKPWLKLCSKSQFGFFCNI